MSLLETHEPTNHRQRQLRGNLQDEIARAPVGDAIQDGVRDLSDQRLHCIDRPRREALVDQSAHLHVPRWIHRDDAHSARLGVHVGQPLRIAQAGSADALGRAEQLRVTRHEQHIRVLRDRPEAIQFVRAGVPVHRSLAPQGTKCFMRLAALEHARIEQVDLPDNVNVGERHIYPPCCAW